MSWMVEEAAAVPDEPLVVLRMKRLYRIEPAARSADPAGRGAATGREEELRRRPQLVPIENSGKVWTILGQTLNV
jgi:hypothetical protein